jgi:hypothetical protein
MAKDTLRVALKELVKEVMVESFQKGIEETGPITDDDFDEARREAEERNIPISQTRAYKRMKSRELRERDQDEDEGQDSRSGVRNRGQVTDPQHDRRLRRNRDEAA